MESSTPAAVQAARSEEIDSPPAEAHVPDCTIWYEEADAVVGVTVSGGVDGAFVVVEAAAKLHTQYHVDEVSVPQSFSSRDGLAEKSYALKYRAELSEVTVHPGGTNGLL